MSIILNNIPPSNIFRTWLLPARFYLNRQAVLAAVSINGLITLNTVVLSVRPCDSCKSKVIQYLNSVHAI